MIDPATGWVRDTGSLRSISGGTYLQWALSGHVQIEVTSLNSNNAAVIGLVLD